MARSVPPCGALLGVGLIGISEWDWLILVVCLLATGALLLLCWLRPQVPIRAALWLITHSFYRLRAVGWQNVPASGPALIVCNHVSYLDWLFLLAAQKRYIRFVIFASWTRRWGLRHAFRWGGALPIDASLGPRAIVQSLRLASDALAAGHVVCIFAEGRFTRTGFLLPFHRGFEQIVKRCPVPVPIIPACLDQVWGSVYSFRGGKLFWKWPQEMPYPVCVAFGKSMPSTSQAAEVRLAIQKLSADCAIERSDERKPVHRQFVRVAARHPFRSCIVDTTGKGQILNYGKVLAGAMCLTRHLRPILGSEAMVGLWLPPSAGASLANIAVAFLGKTAVNLNYTSSADALQSAIRQCGIKHVLTSRRFTAKVALDAGPGVDLVNLEEIGERISRGQKLRAFASVLLLPGFVLDRWVLRLSSSPQSSPHPRGTAEKVGADGPAEPDRVPSSGRDLLFQRPPLSPDYGGEGLSGRPPSGHCLDDIATVIFSSGSTGEPKGVVLSHNNVAANAESMIQAIDLRPGDRVLGVLPFFHSFGYTVTLWAPLQVGASAVYYPDPRQAKEIGELCRKHGCTIFLTTPTFLRFCLRRCDKDDFRTLRILSCGAEKLPQALAQEFLKKFAVLPLEGYGCTELSPAAASNVPDCAIESFRQVGNKPGTIGQPLPGVAARIVHPDTFEPLPIGQDGLLLMFGANVMVGYLDRPELTRQVVRDGWYVTGDMARIDEDGFITITGRLSRFAKIGGEMVPLEKIEEELNAILQTTERICAVTCVPDEARGERIVVLYTPHEGLDVHHLWQQLGSLGLPNLWVPAERDFYEVPELPMLGSGKLHLQRLKEMALERTQTARREALKSS